MSTSFLASCYLIKPYRIVIMNTKQSIRSHYQSQGIVPFYQKHGGTYSNPHVKDIRKCINVVFSMWKPPMNKVLDLACGSGEITSHIKADNITGIDPYTQEAYFKSTGKTALPYSFEDIISGAIQDHSYDLIICSFAMHLLETSRLPALCYALAQVSKNLLILTPHKKPIISWAWNIQGELYLNRVRARWYIC